MTRRTTTKALSAVFAALTFAAHQLPDDAPGWLSLLIGALNAGLVVWLSEREPGTSASSEPAA